MSTIQPKSKREALSDLINGLVDALHSPTNSGLLNPNEFLLKRTLQLAQPLKDAYPAGYWHLQGLIEAYQCNFDKADKIFSNAIILDKNNLSLHLNYLNVLMALGKTEEVETWIKDNYSPTEINYFCLNHLFTLGLFDLNFDTFNRYYEHAPYKSSFSEDFKEQVSRIPFIENIKKGLDELGISTDDFKQVMRFIFTFFATKTLEVFYPYFNFESDLSTLEVNVYLDIDVKTAIQLTNEFESKFVNFSLEKNKTDYLSHFAVFFKPSSMLAEDISYNEDNNILCAEA